MGDWVYIAYGCWFSGDIEVENQVMFGPYCVITPTNHTRANGSFRFGPSTTGRIVIGTGSWLGAGAMVVGNTAIGQGSVLAANSVLTEDAKPSSLYAGSPARRLKEVTG